MIRFRRWRAWASKRWRFRFDGGDEQVPEIRGWAAGQAHLMRDVDETGPPGPEFGAEWSLGDPWHLAVKVYLGDTMMGDCDASNVTLQVAVPFAQFFLSACKVVPSWLLPGDRIIPGTGRNPPWSDRTIYDRTTGRVIGFTVHDGSIWLSFWERGDDSWRKDDPWWWGVQSVDPIELLFGRVKTERIAEDQLGEVEVPMPEGVYKAKAERIRYRTKRSWWPAKHWWRISLDEFVSPAEPVESIDLLADGVVNQCKLEPFAQGKAIPYPGKGENSWDCGMDGCFSMSSPAGVGLPEAIGNLVASVLRTRRKRTGSMAWRPELQEVKDNGGVVGAEGVKEQA